MWNVELLYDVKLSDSQRFADQRCHLLGSSLNYSTQQKTSTLITCQNSLIRSTMKQHECVRIPANAADGLQIIFEVVGVDIS